MLRIKDYYSENCPDSKCVVDENNEIWLEPWAIYPEDDNGDEIEDSEPLAYGLFIAGEEEPIEFNTEEEMFDYMEKYVEEHNNDEDELKWNMVESAEASRQLFIDAEIKKVKKLNISKDFSDYTPSEFKYALIEAIRYFSMSLEMVWNKEKFLGFLPL